MRKQRRILMKKINLQKIEASIKSATSKNNDLKEEQTKLDSILKEHHQVLKTKDQVIEDLKSLKIDFESLEIEKLNKEEQLN